MTEAHELAWRRRARELTPARLFLPGAQRGYDTRTLLALRADHAAAQDAVRAPLDVAQLGRPDLVCVGSCASSLEEHLRRPDLGRRLSPGARATLGSFPAGCDLQVVIGDGLSSAAVHAHVPVVLPALLEAAASRGWSVGRTFAVRHCRVGIMNDVGDLLAPRLVVLLVGERPGLATADSLSAYVAHRPRAGHTDADRNLVSNIHGGGTRPADAAGRIARLLDLLVAAGVSGHAVKEVLPGDEDARSLVP